MGPDRRRTCPAWCVADHTHEDEGGAPRHRGATVVVPGIAIGDGTPHHAVEVQLLIELHADDVDPMVGVYIGDGYQGIDVTVETATRLVRRLVETLRTAGVEPL
jgi:hypothetical protein